MDRDWEVKRVDTRNKAKFHLLNLTEWELISEQSPVNRYDWETMKTAKEMGTD